MNRNVDTGGSTKNGGLFTNDDAIELYRKRISDPELFPQEQKAIERYFTDTNTSVLDIGCGVGRVSYLLHERGFDVTGIDISEPLVEEARSLFPEIDFHIVDIRDTNFNSEAFDYATFSWFGLDYVLPKAKRIEVLREIQRVLKPSGILIFSSHNSWHPLLPFSVNNLRRAVADVVDLYFQEKNRSRIFSRYKIESVPLGEVEIYLSNPVHQWLQLRKCGFTPIDVVGERDGILRFFERDPHYVAKK